MKNINIMIAGAGGNNSWFLNEINRLNMKNQLPPGIEFTIYDGDDVEKKNLLYQDFETKDVLDNKATILAKRYDMHAQPKFIKNTKDFDKFDIVISGVDNRDFRALLFEYMNEHPEKYWIDLRAEGRTVALYSKHKTNTLEKLLTTLPPKGTKSASCQLKYELDNGIIQLGNKIAAMIAAQWLLNHLRGEQNPPEFIHMF